MKTINEKVKKQAIKLKGKVNLTDEHYRMKGQQFSAVKSEIDNSILLREAKLLAEHNKFNLYEEEQDYFFSAHNSMKNNLYLDRKDVLTEWSPDVNWVQLNRELREWDKLNLTPNYLEDMNAYRKSCQRTNLNWLSLSPFNPLNWINGWSKFGINHGTWDSEFLLKFQEILAILMKDFKWVEENPWEVVTDTWHIPYKIKLTDKEYSYIYDEMTMECEMWNILRKTSSSGFPHYKKQDVKYILAFYYEALHGEDSNDISGYFRKHGFKMVFDKFGDYEIVEKDRDIGGDNFVGKVKNMPVTKSFKISAPEWTPYFKPWNSVFLSKDEGLVKKCKDNWNKFIFTTDQSLFDSNHGSMMLKEQAQAIYNSIPDNHYYKDKYLKQVDRAYNNPKIWISAKHYIRLGRWMSVSGVVQTPLQESIGNYGMHYVIIKFELNGEIIYILVQIDDLIAITENEIDLKEFAKILFEKTGFIVNPDKTETNKKGHIMYLQNGIGFILSKDLPLLLDLPEKYGATTSWEDGFGCLAHLTRRDHRGDKRERIFQTHGDIDFYMYDETGSKKQPDVDVQRMLGNISSYGPMAPEERMQITINAYSNTQTFARMIEYCKSKYYVNLGEFGWDPRPYMMYFRDNY